MEDEVLEFIQRRWSNTDANWLCGNCYWFAKILTIRFPYLKLYYLCVRGHFVAGTPSRWYDAQGLNTDRERPVLFEELERTEPDWAKRIIRDCVL